MKSENEIFLNDCKTKNIAFEISQNIRNRRSIYADEFEKKEIPEKLLMEIMTNAIWAPTHKMTEPWRFIVFKGKYLTQMGEHLAEYYKNYYDKRFSSEVATEKFNSLKKYPLKSACVIGIIMVRNVKINLPEWEEIAAISSAVQNMALTSAAYGLGSYWSTSKGAIDYVKGFDLAGNEQSLGLMYMGYYSKNLKPSTKKRTPIDKKVTYYE